jgi:site-specific recombinase XerD
MSIYQKPNGKYLVDIRDEFDTRIRRTFKTKMDAKAFESMYTTSKYQTKLVKNKITKAKYSFEQALNDFEMTKVGLRPKSYQKYKFVLSQLKKFAGALQIVSIDEFTPDHASMLFIELTKEKEIKRKSGTIRTRPMPKTVNFFISTVKAFFYYEVLRDHITKSPMLHIKNLKSEKRKPEFYSIPELKSFFSQNMQDEYRYAFMGLLFTGMRFNELANLTWNNIDFSKKLVYVKPNASFHIKTHNAERAIPMNNELFQLLVFLNKKMKNVDYVFTSPRGKKLRERRMLEVCKIVANKAQIDSRAYLHKFRHTYATMLIRKGVSIEAIKELLGHWSVTETEIYAHNQSDHLHREVSSLNNLLES